MDISLLCSIFRYGNVQSKVHVQSVIDQNEEMIVIVL